MCQGASVTLWYERNSSEGSCFALPVGLQVLVLILRTLATISRLIINSGILTTLNELIQLFDPLKIIFYFIEDNTIEMKSIVVDPVAHLALDIRLAVGLILGIQNGI